MTKRIKALFEFIEFLHSNIQNFNQYDEVISDWVHSADQLYKLPPGKTNFKDDLKLNHLEKIFECKSNIIQKNIIEPIHSKATELNICDIDKKETIWNWNYSEITNLKESFSKEDLPEILEHKKKYIEFRTKTNFNEFLKVFFDGLDATLKELFDYFNETDQNEFEAFEMKGIQARSLSEAIDRVEPGQTKFTFSNSPSPLPKEEAIPFQPVTKQKPEFTIKQIALIHVYSGEQITRKNCDHIIKKYGHNSGESLFQKFTFFTSGANRKGRPTPCTPKKLQNKIELLESVLKHVPTEKQHRINDEVSILKNIYEAEFQ